MSSLKRFNAAVFGSLFVLVAASATAAPVLWSNRPVGLSGSSVTEAPEEAQILDELTAPLSNQQMGLSDGLDFSTTFDDDIKALRLKREEEQRALNTDQNIGDAVLDPRTEGPNLRFSPRLGTATVPSDRSEN